MEETVFFSISKQEMKNILKEAISEHEKEIAKNISSTKVFSFNQVKNILGCSHSTVKKLVNEGILKTTSDQRKVPVWALNEYLQKKE